MAEPRITSKLDSPEDLDVRRRRKEQTRLADANRSLDPWERYRALNDAMDEAYELVDIANREARFALIVMGGLNAALFMLGTRPEILAVIPAAVRPLLAGLMVVYGGVAVYFFIQAIETLRPRRYRPDLPPPPENGRENYPIGIRYYEDVVRRDVEAHWQAWREVKIGQLNAELAVQVHSLSLKNKAKHAALRRLYGGLQLITLLVAGLLLALMFFAFTR